MTELESWRFLGNEIIRRANEMQTYQDYHGDDPTRMYVQCPECTGELTFELNGHIPDDVRLIDHKDYCIVGLAIDLIDNGDNAEAFKKWAVSEQARREREEQYQLRLQAERDAQNKETP